jgi:putative transposase
VTGPRRRVRSCSTRWFVRGRGRCSRPRCRPEVAAYVDAHVEQLDADGRRLVVRNGSHAPREVMTAAGAVPVRAPRVNDKRIDEATGERLRFSSAILPAWARTSPQVRGGSAAAVSAWVVQKRLRSGTEQFLGSGARLSASTITRLTAQWQDEQRAFNARSLADTDYVYVWVDGIHQVA